MVGLVGSPLTLVCPEQASEAGADVKWEDKVNKPTRDAFFAYTSENGINPDHPHLNRFSIDEENNFALTINNITYTDAGKYLCRVTFDGEEFEEESYAVISGKNKNPSLFLTPTFLGQFHSFSRIF